MFTLSFPSDSNLILKYFLQYSAVMQVGIVKFNTILTLRQCKHFVLHVMVHKGPNNKIVSYVNLQPAYSYTNEIIYTKMQV